MISAIASKVLFKRYDQSENRRRNGECPIREIEINVDVKNTTRVIRSNDKRNLNYASPVKLPISLNDTMD